MGAMSAGDAGAVVARASSAPDALVVCSLESWGLVRRRIRILVDEFVARDDRLRVLYVAPAVDVLHEARQGRVRTTRPPRLEQVHPRIHVLRPRKWLPRVAGPFAQRTLERQVVRTAGILGLAHPLLWINDAAYAELVTRTEWPSLYDITDDWLLAPLAPRQRRRLIAEERLLLGQCDAVVVCSEELAATKGRDRSVVLVPNGVDVDLFRGDHPRPPALPPSPTAVYVGTLHAERIDVDLVRDLATALPDVAVTLVGPNELPAPTTAVLAAISNVHLLGPCPYEQVPAYLRNADVVIVPHLVNAFTESLDPIKAYECLAVERPTVATPVAGFRQLAGPVTVVGREGFAGAVRTALEQGSTSATATVHVPTWHERADAMARVMANAVTGRVGR